MALILGFIGNVMAATSSCVAGQNAIVVGNEYIPTSLKVTSETTFAVYKVTTEDYRKFKVAVETPYTSAEEKQFVASNISEAEGKVRFANLMLSNGGRELVAEALEQAAEELASIADLKTEQAAARKAEEERVARHEKLAKELVEAKIAAGKKAKADLDAMLNTVSVGDKVFHATQSISGKVVKVETARFRYVVQSGKKTFFFPATDTVTEASRTEAFFNGTESKRVVSHKAFKRLKEAMSVAINAGAKLFDTPKANKEFVPAFDFSSDKLTGCDKTENGWEHFSKPVDNSKQ